VKFLLVPNWELLCARTQILTKSLFEKAKVHHNEDLPFIQTEIDVRMKMFNLKYCAFGEIQKNFPNI